MEVRFGEVYLRARPFRGKTSYNIVDGSSSGGKLLEAVARISDVSDSVTFLLDVCPTWTRGVALVDLQRRSALRRNKLWDTR
jgi:hypothetical protein